VDFRTAIGFNCSISGGFAFSNSGQIRCKAAAVRDDADVFVGYVKLAGLHSRQATANNYDRMGKKSLCLSDVSSAFG
jgi:DNA-binding IclR family transcriptional regulator